MKKVLLVVVSAFVIGGGLALYFFNGTVKKQNKIEGYEEVSAFQIGVFTNYENALKVAERNNGIVVNDQNIYRVYIAMLKDEEAIDMLGNYYKNIGLSYYIKDIVVSSSFVENLNVYEEMIKKSSSDTYNTINNDVLTKYQEYL